MTPHRDAVAMAFASLVSACAASDPPPATPARAATPAVAPPSLDAPVRTCLKLATCAGKDALDLSSCVSSVIARASFDPNLTCVQNARTCAEVERCLGREPVVDAKRACESRPGALVFCDGDKLVSCESETPRVQTCADVRGTCREVKVASNIVLRGCASPLCNDPNVRERCDGPGAALSCQQGLAERTRCPSGTRCEESAGPGGDVEARCVPVAKKPCVPGAPRCEGNVLVSCLAGEDGRGGIVETDCAQQGMRCDGSAATGASCVASDRCAGGKTWCEGGALRFCAAGVPVRASCERYGLGPCSIDAGGARCGAFR